LTHGNFVAVLRAAELAGNIFTNESVHVSYLPLAHVFEKQLILPVLKSGGRIGFFRGDGKSFPFNHLTFTLF